MCESVLLTQIIYNLHNVAMIIDDGEFFNSTNVLTTTGLFQSGSLFFFCDFGVHSLHPFLWLKNYLHSEIK